MSNLKSASNRSTILGEKDFIELPPRKVGKYEVALLTQKDPDKTGPNEDCVSYYLIDSDHLVLCVADGVGGSPKGHEASRTTLETIAKYLEGLESAKIDDSAIRSILLNALEQANQTLIARGQGSHTTLTACLLCGSQMQTFQVGDSSLLVTGLRGKLKYKTAEHSPVGYAIQAGLIDENKALEHPDRHIITNVVGDSEMKIEMGPQISLSARDTVFLASDGVFDNFRVEELVELVRKGSLPKVFERIKTVYQNRLAAKGNAKPLYKNDDFSFVLCRYRPQVKTKKTSTKKETREHGKQDSL